jgi:(p)ppGpp synthase/HD superfamily hydrolase
VSAPRPLGRRFAEAATWAWELHAGQARKGTDTPYLAHLLGVASLALEHGADEDEAIAAMLHDAAEDQGGEGLLREIERRLGPRVAAIVDGCTDSYAEPKPPWRERKERHLERLARADGSVRLVMACDKVHNLRALARDLRSEGAQVWNRYDDRSAADVAWYYHAAVTVLGGGGGDLPTSASPVLRDLVEALAAFDLAMASSGT